MTEKRALCSGCDIYCQVLADTPESGKVGDVRVKAMDPRPLKANICIKGVHAPAGFSHPERVLYPLKRTGPRGSGRWQRVSWDQAMDDIGARLSAIVATHGAEALAVSTSQWNTQTDNGAARRFMNLLGSPNWISGVALCSGNTAAINRMVYGWYPYPDFDRGACTLDKVSRPVPMPLPVLRPGPLTIRTNIVPLAHRPPLTGPDPCPRCTRRHHARLPFQDAHHPEVRDPRPPPPSPRHRSRRQPLPPTQPS